ncbi:hypothetical protein TNCV_22051 [Trichonephila clavipes]|nr:hypothetical protein TNCV_22051 [Trichonephila clavipes]
MSRITLECRLLKCVGVSGQEYPVPTQRPNCTEYFHLSLPCVPAGMSSIKIAEEKGFVAMDENCIEFRSNNGTVWRSINTRHSNLTVVS